MKPKYNVGQELQLKGKVEKIYVSGYGRSEITVNLNDTIDTISQWTELIKIEEKPTDDIWSLFGKEITVDVVVKAITITTSFRDHANITYAIVAKNNHDPRRIDIREKILDNLIYSAKFV